MMNGGINREDWEWGWRRVITVSNWNNYDALDQEGKPILRSGRYRIKWADGTITVEDVIVKREIFQYSDMGHAYQGMNQFAYVKVNVKGTMTDVRIVGLMVKWEPV